MRVKKFDLMDIALDLSFIGLFFMEKHLKDILVFTDHCI